MTMQDLARHLRSLKLFSHIPLKQLEHLLEHCPVATARAGDLLLGEADSERLHLLLLAGTAEAERSWTTPDQAIHSSRRPLSAPKTGAPFAFLGATARTRVRAVTEVRYLVIDGDTTDELTGWNQRFSEAFVGEPELQRRIDLIKQIGLFRNLPLENATEAFKRMRPRAMQAGETVIRQGEKGDAYYIVDTGEAEVIRTDAMSGETGCVARLGSGDGFGEEALLQDGYRNATVTMLTPGQLLVLEKHDFDALIKPSFVEEIAPEQALTMIDSGQAHLLDCRYDLEYEESRIPGATLLPLDTLRAQVHRLDPEATYIVYCRSGRRSMAGAFLLRERNIRALSLAGGITGWPYEIDSSPA